MRLTLFIKIVFTCLRFPNVIGLYFLSFLGSHNEDAFVHNMPGCGFGHPLDRQVDPGRVGLPLLRRLHDPAQTFAQIPIHTERTGRCKLSPSDDGQK